MAARGIAALLGFLVPRKEAKFRDVLDGLANTVAMGEIITDLGDNDARSRAVDSDGPDIWLADGAVYCDGWLDADRPQFWDPAFATFTGNDEQRRGYKWALGLPFYTGMNTRVFL